MPDVTKDPRYINAVPDVRSELVVPLLLKDRCIGVFDLESPELDAFNKKHVELLTLLASQAAVAIENARLYEAIRANEARFEKELRLRAARADGAAAAGAAEAAARRGRGLAFRSGARARRRHLRLPVARSRTRWSSRSATCRARACRRRSTARRSARWCAAARSGAGSRSTSSTPAGVLAGMNRILHERKLEEYYCTLCYAMFEFKKQIVTFANSGLPYPVQCSNGKAAQIDMPGVPLGSFGGSHVRRLPGAAGSRATCSCSARTASSKRSTRPGEEFGAARVHRRDRAHAHAPRRKSSTRSSARCSRSAAMRRQSDDQTVVVVKINQLGPARSSEVNRVAS